MSADGGGVEAGIDAGEEDDKIFGDEIGNGFITRGEELGFGGFPGSGNTPYAFGGLRCRGGVILHEDTVARVQQGFHTAGVHRVWQARGVEERAGGRRGNAENFPIRRVCRP